LSSLHQSFSDIESNRDGIPIPQPEADVQATQRQSAKFAGPKKRFYLCRSVTELPERLLGAILNKLSTTIEITAYYPCSSCCLRY